MKIKTFPSSKDTVLGVRRREQACAGPGPDGGLAATRAALVREEGGSPPSPQQPGETPPNFWPVDGVTQTCVIWAAEFVGAVSATTEVQRILLWNSIIRKTSRGAGADLNQRFTPMVVAGEPLGQCSLSPSLGACQRGLQRDHAHWLGLGPPRLAGGWGLQVSPPGSSEGATDHGGKQFGHFFIKILFYFF